VIPLLKVDLRLQRVGSDTTSLIPPLKNDVAAYGIRTFPGAGRGDAIPRNIEDNLTVAGLIHLPIAVVVDSITEFLGVGWTTGSTGIQ